MSQLKLITSLLFATALAACSGIEVSVTPGEDFAAGQYSTYSWRSEPFQNVYHSQDAIYVIDPILRKIVDADLKAKGYQLVAGKGDMTIDYIYAPGLLPGAPNETADFLSPRAGVRPNNNVSQAERDNAVALSGVKETRNVTLQLNSGKTGRGIWAATITKMVADVNKTGKSRTRKALESGVKEAFKEMPPAR
jgi:hypothetical protein